MVEAFLGCFFDRIVATWQGVAAFVAVESRRVSADIYAFSYTTFVPS